MTLLRQGAFNCHTGRLIAMLLFLSLGVYAKCQERVMNLLFENDGIYSVRVSRTGAINDYGCPEGGGVGYTDSVAPAHNFESTQVLEGFVADTGGSESVEVLALNCKSLGIFRTFADRNGRFTLNVGEFADSTVFNIDAYDKMDPRRTYDVTLEEPALPAIPPPAFLGDDFIEGASVGGDTVRVLKCIEVTAPRKEALNPYKIEPSRAMMAGDPMIYRFADVKSLLRYS